MLHFRLHVVADPTGYAGAEVRITGPWAKWMPHCENCRTLLKWNFCVNAGKYNLGPCTSCFIPILNWKKVFLVCFKKWQKKTFRVFKLLRDRKISLFRCAIIFGNGMKNVINIRFYRECSAKLVIPRIFFSQHWALFETVSFKLNLVLRKFYWKKSMEDFIFVKIGFFKRQCF